MFCRQQRSTIRFLNQLKRFWSDGCLVVQNDSKSAVNNLAPSVKYKSRRTKDDDPENMWLNNLNKENLKLYRKTSFGSYRKINMANFLEKLKVILPEQFERKETFEKSSVENVKDEPVQVEKKEDILASPHMCELLIKNMVMFPLLRAQCEESLKNVVDHEEKVEMFDTLKYPSVTRILQETIPLENKEKLDRWQQHMIKKMGLEKFNEYKQDIFNQGLKFHGALRKYLESGDEKLVSIDQTIEGCWNSVEKVLEDINNVVMVEQSLCHPILSYKGNVDCVASYRGVPYVIEWKKTGKKVKDISRLYDAPVQASAYLGALSWKKDLAGTAPNKCLLVIAYTSGEPADVFPLDLENCKIYWSDFMYRLQFFWRKKWPELKPKESQN